MSSCSKEIFIKEFVAQLKCEKAALFIGSGISRNAGYANWKDILRECAEEIELNVEKEEDLITLAEFYVKGKQRTKIDKTIASYFRDSTGTPQKVHELITTLPLRSIWTTNYDTLIERAYSRADITYSVVTNDDSYISSNPAATIKIHKIHGDVNCPKDCVITRKDYEKYEETHDIVLSELKGEMCTNSFLFLGYSFSDIDIQHILSKIRLIYEDEHPQRHYCIIEKIKLEKCESQDDYEYKCKRQIHHINDMQSYGLNVVLVDDYNEIEGILQKISHLVNINDVLICGAYENNSNLAQVRISPVAAKLAELLINNDFKIITGYGKNLGTDIVTGAFIGCATAGVKAKRFNDNVHLCPFPFKLPETIDRKELYTNLRKNMIAKTRISIFISGEKLSKSGDIIDSDGVWEEYELSKRQGNLIIPIATTGGISRRIWNAENESKSQISQTEEFQLLNKEVDPEKIVNIVLQIINNYIKQNK